MNWAERGGGSIRSRAAAENLMLRYARESSQPAVAMCVANTHGPGETMRPPRNHRGLRPGADAHQFNDTQTPAVVPPSVINSPHGDRRPAPFLPRHVVDS